MNKLIRLAMPALIATFMLAGAANAQINDILKRVDDHYKSLTSVKADIKREQVNAQLGETDNYSGTVILLPNKKNAKDMSLRLDWKKPEEESMSVLNGQFVAYKPSLNQAWTGSSSSKKVKSGGGGVLGVLSMGKAEIKANYDVQYLGEENASGTQTWHLKLTPKAKSDFKVADIWIDKDGMPIQAKVTMPNNDTDTILLSSIKKNETIDLAIFRISVPKTAKIVKA